MDQGRQRASKPLGSPQLFRPGAPRKKANGGADPLLLAPDVLDDATRRELLHDVLRPRRASPSAMDHPRQPHPSPGAAGDVAPEKEPFANQLRSRVRSGSNTNGDDLVTAMASRLKDLEAKHRAYQAELQELHTKYRQLNDRYQHERQLREEAETAVLTLYDEKELLEAQLREMEVAHGSGGPRHGERGTQATAGSNPAATPPAATFGLFGGDFVDGAGDATAASAGSGAAPAAPTHFLNTARSGTVLFSPQKGGVSPGPAANAAPDARRTDAGSSPSPPQQQQQQQRGRRHSAETVDVELLRKNARILSDYVGWKGVVKQGNQAGIRERDVVRVVLYKNGICVNQGPFRPYGWALCDAFLDDLTEGYYPYEFKEKYPDGFPIEVTDRTTETCETDKNGAVRGGNPSSSSAAPTAAGPSFPKEGGRRLGGGDGQQRVHTLDEHKSGAGYTPVSADEFLKRVPAQKVTAGGQLVAVREGVAALMGIAAKGSTESPASGTVKHVSAAEAAYRRAVVQQSASPEGAPAAAAAVACPMVLGHLIAFLIRTPNGQKVMLHMAPDDTVAALRREFVAAVPTFQAVQYELYQALPEKREWKEHQRTLASMGVEKTCTLMVKLLK